MHNRLSAANVGAAVFPVTLDPEIANFPVPRIFFSSTYGGSFVETFPTIAAEKFADHGYDNFMGLNMDYHPNAPQTVGAPGIWLDCDPFDWSRDPLQRVLSRISSYPALWLYCGQYRIIRSEPLTTAEWAMQPNLVCFYTDLLRNAGLLMKGTQTKRTWVNQIIKQKWGKNVRARVEFRKMYQRDPTYEEEQDFTKGEATKHLTPSVPELHTAFEIGEEVCVSSL